jgi:ABC-2 type transport system permease protein/sodium transport system permease protein
MVVAMVPGFITVMPGLELNSLLSVTPLANIVLLARDVLKGGASPLWGAVAVLSTTLYGALALTLAARIFGSDSILYGSEGSWSDLFRRPSEPRPAATISGALAALAIVTPLFVIASGILAQLHEIAMPAQLAALAGTSLLLFVALPLGLARMQGVALDSGFQLRRPGLLALFGAAVMGCSLWAIAYDLIVLCQDLGIATLSEQKLEAARPGLEALLERWRALPLPLVLVTFAVIPAVGEELFFRGYLLGALRGRLPVWAAIGLTAAVFGLFHASVGGIIAIERVLASTFLGLVLGWVCWTSRSVWPGIALHALSNGLMLLISRYGEGLKAHGWDLEQQRYLPLLIVGLAAVAALAGASLVWLGRHRQALASPMTNPSPLPLA